MKALLATAIFLGTMCCAGAQVTHPSAFPLKLTGLAVVNKPGGLLILSVPKREAEMLLTAAAKLDPHAQALVLLYHLAHKAEAMDNSANETEVPKQVVFLSTQHHLRHIALVGMWVRQVGRYTYVDSKGRARDVPAFEKSSR
jgi:hypothetical protein